MVNIAEILKVIEKHLEDMNLSPWAVVIASFEETGDLVFIQGQFQKGFLGDVFNFATTYDPNKYSLTKFQILGKSG